MVIKKYGNSIFGASFTKNEQKAIDMEISRQLSDYNMRNAIELDAMVLLALIEEFGFGEKRLHTFFDRFNIYMDELRDRYEMDDCDVPWLATKKLLDRGIDIKQWYDNKRGDA